MFKNVVLIGGQEAPATTRIGGSAEAKALLSWEVEANHDQKSRDAVEYAEQAGKKWVWLKDLNRCPTDVAEAGDLIRSNPVAEICYLLVQESPALEQHGVLGFTLVRRTWANNLVVDFLATNPAVLTAAPKIQGVGVGILAGICALADQLNAGFVWGEATDMSAKFYQHVFSLPRPSDLFLVDGTGYRGFLNNYAKKE